MDLRDRIEGYGQLLSGTQQLTQQLSKIAKTVNLLENIPNYEFAVATTLANMLEFRIVSI